MLLYSVLSQERIHHYFLLVYLGLLCRRNLLFNQCKRSHFFQSFLIRYILLPQLTRGKWAVVWYINVELFLNLWFNFLESRWCLHVIHSQFRNCLIFITQLIDSFWLIFGLFLIFYWYGMKTLVHLWQYVWFRITLF